MKSCFCCKNKSQIKKPSFFKKLCLSLSLLKPSLFVYHSPSHLSYTDKWIFGGSLGTLAISLSYGIHELMQFGQITQIIENE